MYFIHGMGDTISTSDTIQKVGALQDLLDMNVISLEYNTENGIYRYADIMSLVGSQISTATTKTLFIGESMGGYIAAQLACAYNAKALLCCPVSNVYNDTYVDAIWKKNWPRWYYYGSYYVTTTEEYLQAFNSFVAYDPRVVLPSKNLAVIYSTSDTLITSVYDYYNGHAGFIYNCPGMGHCAYRDGNDWKFSYSLAINALLS